MLSKKAIKILALACDPAATEGEWHNAAVRFARLLRREGFDVRSMSTKVDGKDRAGRVMSFGKYKGQPVSEIPDSYLVWLSERPDLDDWLMAAVKSELETRGLAV